MTRLLLVAWFWLVSSLSYAFSPEASLPDPAQEARAQALFREIRCVVCQGESIADSGADVATDMRLLIRTRINEGATDNDILVYLVSQYGNNLLMKPPLLTSTLLLWLAPLLLLLSGAAIAIRYAYQLEPSRRGKLPAVALDPDGDA